MAEAALLLGPYLCGKCIPWSLREVIHIAPGSDQADLGSSHQGLWGKAGCGVRLAVEKQCDKSCSLQEPRDQKIPKQDINFFPKSPFNTGFKRAVPV